MIGMADRYSRLLDQARREFPKLRVVAKAEKWWHRWIDRFLKVVTLGRMSTYLTAFTTTIGSTVYVPSEWGTESPDERYVTLRHELVHVRQFKRFTVPLMALLYLLFPLPLGLAWARMRFERAAYEETIRAAAEIWGVDWVQSKTCRDHVLNAFTGPSYGWMWPFRKDLEKWYDGVAASL